MSRTKWVCTALLALSALIVTGCAQRTSDLISEREAIEAALAEVDGEILGVRFDEPDTQWDVFVKAGEQAYEIEIDAETGEVVAAEKESLAEVQAELSGDLSHEGTEGDVDP